MLSKGSRHTFFFLETIDIHFSPYLSLSSCAHLLSGRVALVTLSLFIMKFTGQCTAYL